MTATPTLRELFVSTNTGKLDAGLRLPPPPDTLVKLVTATEWTGMSERVLDLLDINVVDVLVGGWKAQREVRRELLQTSQDPARTAIVHLADHSIQSTHTPSIEVRSQGRKLFELSFPLELTFEIEAVRLTIRNGSIGEIRPGEVKVRGALKLENAVLLERGSAPIKLPGTIRLDESRAGNVASPDEETREQEQRVQTVRAHRSLGSVRTPVQPPPAPVPSVNGRTRTPSAAAGR